MMQYDAICTSDLHQTRLDHEVWLLHVTSLLSISLDRFLAGISDRGKAYTDVPAGALVLLNSFVMLVELEIEGCVVGKWFATSYRRKDIIYSSYK